MANLYMSEDWIQQTDDGKRYNAGDSGVFEAFTDNVGQLFKDLQRERGRCVSKVYVDTDAGAQAVGWVFEKRRKYDDCNKTFLAETWVTLHDSPPTRTVKNHYHAI